MTEKSLRKKRFKGCHWGSTFLKYPFINSNSWVIIWWLHSSAYGLLSRTVYHTHVNRFKRPTVHDPGLKYSPELWLLNTKPDFTSKVHQGKQERTIALLGETFKLKRPKLEGLHVGLREQWLLSVFMRLQSCVPWRNRVLLCCGKPQMLL